MDARERDWAAAMRAAQAGCAVSYAGLLAEIAATLRSPLAARLGRFGFSPTDAEDVLQEVLIALHRKRDTWDPARPFLPWLGAIARRRLVDAARRLGRARRLASDLRVEDLADELAAPCDAATARPGDAERLIAALPAREREIVAALALDGQATPVVAARFGISEGAVRVAFHRGLARLRRLAQGHAPEPETGR